MKTVLIVEDEKMIRQGIRTMVQRSGVPVEVIMECSNGEAALEIVREQKIDVMFTDIRMPKMDGIQLVKEIQKLDERPQIVAISGYDDFSYAVEMLRNGVREYILKPVERQKITEILEKLEEELLQKQKQKRTERRIDRNQIRLLLSTDMEAGDELALLEEKYGEDFFPDGYQVCIAGKGFVMEEREDVFFIDDLQDGNLCIVLPGLFGVLQKNELWHEYAGVSAVHRGLCELKTAYDEAFSARKSAFYTETPFIEYGGVKRASIPEGLRRESLKQIEEAAWTQRLHLIGTDKTDEMEGQWRSLLLELQKERIEPEEFESGIAGFLDELLKLYRNIIGEKEAGLIAGCRIIYQYSCVQEYWEELMELVMGLHRRINYSGDTNRNQQKIRQALEYVKENYSKDLNMAVVSNYVSMNYSLFSYEFKQYTGSNFVNFLKELRVAEAKRLLAETDRKVVEISQQVGYENEKHFMKTFKSICGVSPSEYRRNVSRK